MKAVLTLVAVVVLGWIGVQPVLSAEKSTEKRTVALFVSTEVLRTPGWKGMSDKLESQWKTVTGHPITNFDPTLIRSVPSALLWGAILRSDAVVVVHRPTEEPNDFISALAYETNTGIPFTHTSVHSKDYEPASRIFSGWFKDVNQGLSKKPAFDARQFARRLEKEDRCGDLAEFVSEYDPREKEEEELTQLLIRCTPRLVQKMEIPKEYLLRIQMLSVPEKYKAVVVQTAVDLNLGAEMLKLTRYLSDLTVTCDKDCRKGSLRFRIAFDRDLYLAEMKKGDDPVQPFRNLSRLFLTYREELAKATAKDDAQWDKFSMGLDLQGSVPDMMPIRISGTARKFTLEPEPVTLSFLQSGR